MFEIHNIDGRYAPVLVCDICGEHIKDAGLAAVVFSNFTEPGSKLKALHVHKGNIGGKTCHDEADSLIHAGGGTPGWQELQTCLMDLAHNTGFPPAKMSQADKRRSDYFIA